MWGMCNTNTHTRFWDQIQMFAHRCCVFCLVSSNFHLITKYHILYHIVKYLILIYPLWSTPDWVKRTASELILILHIGECLYLMHLYLYLYHRMRTSLPGTALMTQISCGLGMMGSSCWRFSVRVRSTRSPSAAQWIMYFTLWMGDW